jgi:hypothetical protein
MLCAFSRSRLVSNAARLGRKYPMVIEMRAAGEKFILLRSV